MAPALVSPMSHDENKDLSIETISGLFASAASTKPTPGGGCVSAICGYLGISLLLKSIRISARKQNAGNNYAALDRRLVDFSSQLLTLAQADSDAFGSYIDALRLPKETPAQQAVRKQALTDAARRAAETALSILDIGNDVLDSAHQVQFGIAPTIRADEAGCVELISAMNTTAENNARANLSGVQGGEDLKKRLSDGVAKHSKLLAACHSS